MILKSEGGYIMCVLAAPHKAVFHKLRDYLGAKDVEKAREAATRSLSPDREE